MANIRKPNFLGRIEEMKTFEQAVYDAIVVPQTRREPLPRIRDIRNDADYMVAIKQLWRNLFLIWLWDNGMSKKEMIEQKSNFSLQVPELETRFIEEYFVFNFSEYDKNLFKNALNKLIMSKHHKFFDLKNNRLYENTD